MKNNKTILIAAFSLLVAIFFFESKNVKAQSLLKDYDSSKKIYSMVCNSPTGSAKYSIKGEKILINDFPVWIVSERDGDIFATKTDTSQGETIVILDYKKRVLTYIVAGTEERFRCYG